MSVVVGTVKDLVQWLLRPFQSWARRTSLYPIFIGQKCCAIEMAAAMMPRWDTERLGVLARASPRHCDMFWVNGPVTIKFASRARRIYDQMPSPKFVFATGECAISGGPFWEGYSMLEGADQIFPVDVYVPGCPPRPEAILYGIWMLQDKIKREKKWIPEHLMPQIREFYERTKPPYEYKPVWVREGIGEEQNE